MVASGVDVMGNIRNTLSVIFPFLPFIILFVIFAFIISLILRGLKRSKYMIRVLYIQSQESADIRKIYAPDISKVKIDNNFFDLRKCQPLIIKTLLGRQPLYIANDKSIFGLLVKGAKNKEDKNFTAEITNSPKAVSSVVENKHIEDIMKASVSGKRIDFIVLLGGVAMGIALFFILQSMGVFA